MPYSRQVLEVGERKGQSGQLPCMASSAVAEIVSEELTHRRQTGEASNDRAEREGTGYQGHAKRSRRHGQERTRVQEKRVKERPINQPWDRRSQPE